MPDSTPSNPPVLAIKFANTIFVLALVFAVIAFLYTAYRIYQPLDGVTLNFYFISILFFGLLIGFFSFGLWKFSSDLRVNLSLIFTTLGIAVYGSVTYLEFFAYDTRGHYEVFDDLRASGIEIYPLHSASKEFS